MTVVFGLVFHVRSALLPPAPREDVMGWPLCGGYVHFAIVIYDETGG